MMLVSGSRLPRRNRLRAPSAKSPAQARTAITLAGPAEPGMEA
jgi:hypothetical protein